MTKKVTRITTEETSPGVTPFWDDVDKIGQQKLSVNINGIATPMTAAEAVLNMLVRGALKGSAQNIRQFNELQRMNADLRQQEIDANCERWRRIRDHQHKIYGQHRRTHAEDPLDFPHPDDIVIDPRKGVRITGPINLEEHKEVLNTQACIDAFYWQDALETALNGARCRADAGPSSGLLLATLLNTTLPKRLRLSQHDSVAIMMRRSHLSRRALLKETHQAWRRAGQTIPRGARLPRMDIITTWMGTLSDSIAIIMDDTISKPERDRQIDTLVGQVFGSNDQNEIR